MNFIGIIPARYASTRFPGKPLAKIYGKTMIHRVYEQALKSEKLLQVVVATDDHRIFDEVKRIGGNVVMTSQNHTNGTSRCFEALKIVLSENAGYQFDVVINIQGDEPFISPLQIDTLAGLFTDQTVQIGSLIKEITDIEELFDHNVVKVVKDKFDNALYFSRQPLPYLYNFQPEKWLEHHTFYKHIGIYAYRSMVLEKIAGIHTGNLDTAENLEQLLWLENKLIIKLALTKTESIGIDTQQDLSKLTNISL